MVQRFMLHTHTAETQHSGVHVRISELLLNLFANGSACTLLYTKSMFELDLCIRMDSLCCLALSLSGRVA